MSNSHFRKLGVADLEALKLVLVEAVFEGLAEAEDPAERAKFIKLGLDLVKDAKMDWLTDVASHLEFRSPTINADAVSVSLSAFDLRKYLIEEAQTGRKK